MYTSKNTIKQSEINITPIKIKYPCEFKSNVPAANPVNPDGLRESGIITFYGYNDEINPSGSVENTTLNYRLLRQLYYQNYLTGSLLNSASYWDSNQQSTACSETAEFENRYFPTESHAQIKGLYIPPKITSEQITPSSFRLEPTNGSGVYIIVDDGNGNLIDINLGLKFPVHVGNILYSQGIIVITNEDYLPILKRWGFIHAVGASVGNTTVKYTDSEGNYQYIHFPVASDTDVCGITDSFSVVAGAATIFKNPDQSCI